MQLQSLLIGASLNISFLNVEKQVFVKWIRSISFWCLHSALVTVWSQLVFYFAVSSWLSWHALVCFEFQLWVIHYMYCMFDSWSNVVFRTPCDACFRCFYFPLTWFQSSAHCQPDKDLFIWIRCVGAGKHPKHAGHGTPRTRNEKHWPEMAKHDFNSHLIRFKWLLSRFLLLQLC